MRTRDLASLTAGVIEPALLRRAGLSIQIAARWREIVGPSLADVTRPIRVKWARRAYPGAEPLPGTLVIACSGATGLRVQHESDQIVERLNAVFGRETIGSLRIEQRPVDPPLVRARPRTPTEGERAAVASALAGLSHERLRASLARLGERVVVRASTSPSNVRGENIADGHAPIRAPDRTEHD